MQGYQKKIETQLKNLSAYAAEDNVRGERLCMHACRLRLNHLEEFDCLDIIKR